MVFNRNTAVAWPFVFPLIGAGFASLFAFSVWVKMRRFFPKWLIPALLCALFAAEPLARTTYSLSYDFKKDSRPAAREWMNKNFNPNAIVGCSKPGWGTPVDEQKFHTLCFTLPVPFFLSSSLDYYVMDSWFYEHWGLGRDLLREPIYYEHAFLNTGSFPYPVIRYYQDKFLSHFVLIQKFGKPQYCGPEIYIYKRKS